MGQGNVQGNVSIDSVTCRQLLSEQYDQCYNMVLDNRLPLTVRNDAGKIAYELSKKISALAQRDFHENDAGFQASATKLKEAVAGLKKAIEDLEDAVMRAQAIAQIVSILDDILVVAAGIASKVA